MSDVGALHTNIPTSKYSSQKIRSMQWRNSQDGQRIVKSPIKKQNNELRVQQEGAIQEKEDSYLGPISGTLLTGFMAAASLRLPGVPFFNQLPIAPAIYAILIGMLYGNTIHDRSGSSFIQKGITFSKQKLLRLGIMLYGFRIAFQQIISLGPAGLLTDLFIMSTTVTLGWLVGTRLLKLDDKVTLLLSSGCSVCGVTAVLATEQVVDAEMHQTSMSVATIVIFGTVSMFLYPFLYKYLPFDARQMGIYTGSTVHELAGVVAAGNAMGPDVTAIAVITKLTRVMLLGPFLLAMSAFRSMQSKSKNDSKKKLYIPWFALGFVVISAINSLNIVPIVLVERLKICSVWMLHMALAALGIETNFEKVKDAGFKPILVDIILFVHLTISGFFFTKFATSIF